MSPERNNFKELFKEEELRFHEKQKEEDNIASDIWRTLDFFKLIGQVVDMFIPKVFELIIAALGGKNDAMNSQEQSNTTIRPPSQAGGKTDPRNIEPSSPNDNDSPRGPDRAE